jgi:hypothetical protein
MADMILRKLITLKIKLKHCKIAEADHKECKRQYAHTYHYESKNDSFESGEIVCIAKAFNSLPIEYKMGILAHEIGHLIAGYEADEITADITARNALGVRIRYKNSEHGRNLQFLNKADTEMMQDILNE